jgi:uncharacterized protein
MTVLTESTDEVDGIPVRWVTADAPAGMALWLTHLGGSAEQSGPMLTRLAHRGLLAVSFDPPGHGPRGNGRDPMELGHEVFGAFRRRMWPLAGLTVLESLRVLDWADQRFGTVGPHFAGGVSMDGDAAVALAGIDERITRVAALVSTPDWSRPGMRELSDYSVVLNQGDADSYAQWFYDAFDPVTHLDSFRRDLAIKFLCGASDLHVPAEAALRFRAALGERVQVELFDGLDHLGAARDERLYEAALEWLTP